ncbi:MAG TPA: penicillin acylase family protein, partial [Steroidobacteraceae bacterium]|nr:penicillin acylase family protein [Steroidobacteraceae bacterium]
IAAAEHREQPACASHDASITRDEWGIAHVRGHTDADAIFGMMYAQAEDDFNRIETNYLVSLGRLGEAEGESALWQDLRQRLFIDSDTLQAYFARSPEWLRKLMRAWAAGLNCYLATHPQVRPRVITRFEPWMALSFSEGSIGGDIERVPLSQLEAFYSGKKLAMTAGERGLSLREPQGSNGFAIAPSHTKNGHALLLINPHTSFFFRSELQVTSSEGLNAYGAATWGQFFIYQGFNERAGWMHTSSGADNVDEFAETIVTDSGGKHSYRYGQELRPVETKVVTLAYKGAHGVIARRSFTTYATHHGPIVREADGKWIAFALINEPVAALQQSFLRTKSSDYARFIEVAQLKANSSNNTLFADSQGVVAYLHPQFMPIRNDRYDYRKPVDGSDPATDWQGLHDLDSLPRVVTPANGWVMNVNNWPWTAAGANSPKASNFPRYMDQAGENARGIQAQRVLSARKDFTLQTLIAAAYDSYLTAFARLVPSVLTAYDALPQDDSLRAKLAGPVDLLRGWNYRWSLDSQPTSLAVFFGEALWSTAAEPAQAAGLSQWDYMTDRTTPAQKLAALAQAADRLTQDFGSWRVPWGEINRFQRNDGAIVQKFDDAKPSTPAPFTSAQWGSLASFGARRYPGTRRYYGTSGNSFVAAVEFGPSVRALAVSIGGASGRPESKHFVDQVQRYMNGDLRPVYFYPKDLQGHTEGSYRPGEKSDDCAACDLERGLRNGERRRRRPLCGVVDISCQRAASQAASSETKPDMRSNRSAAGRDR